MSKSKKDVHITGALAAVLNAGNVTTVDQRLKSNEENAAPRILNSSSINHLNDLVDSAAQPAIAVVNVSPDDCQPWKFADRQEAEMGDLEALANSIETTGQLEPVLLRPMTNDGTKYEIIYGNRRWRACKLKGLQLQAIVKDIDDQMAALCQQEENQKRENISDYSKALHYQSLLDNHVFKTTYQLSKQLNIPKNRLYELMSFTKIPIKLREAIPSMHTISLRMAIKIAKLADDPTNLDLLYSLADDIASQKISPNKLEAKLHNLKNGTKVKTTQDRILVLGKGGAEIFTIRKDSNGAPCIVFHKAARSVIALDDIKQLLKDHIDMKIENSNVFQD